MHQATLISLLPLLAAMTTAAPLAPAGLALLLRRADADSASVYTVDKRADADSASVYVVDKV